jgi:4-hydroxy-4-methyl-2-oxoglutarate aldolase
MQANDTAAELVGLGTATLGESGARAMSARIRPMWRGAAFAAPAVPVRCTPGDNLAIHAAVASAPPGHALVVDVGAIPERGYWGEVLTTGAQTRGVVGLVIDGGVRDVAALPGATKASPGSVGEPVEVGGVEVEQGDWVVGDVDGVVLISGGSLPRVLEAGRVRAEKEMAFFGALRGGATTVELLGLDVSIVRVAGP